jgi:hypothetical protein
VDQAMSDVSQVITSPPQRIKRMRWYYTAIIDWMMANPGGKLGDCAAHVGKTQPWLSIIVNSDMFKAALAERQRQNSETQDAVLRQKLTEVSVATLDQLLDNIKTKKNAIPIESLTRLQDSTLSKLGYGIEKAAPVQVNVNQTNQVAVPISQSELEAARQLMRQHQQGLVTGPTQSTSLPRDAASPLLEGAALVNEPEE